MKRGFGLVVAHGTAALVLAACSGRAHTGSGRAGRPTTRSTAPTVEPHPRGGSARVGVWGDPDPSADTLAGAAARSLVLPQLFVAQPNGSWKPSLVAAGSSRLAGDRLSATFRIRTRAVWSDGAPITAADLRRSADTRFVAAVDDPGADGTITVHFTHPLKRWERLWSATASVAAPRPGVYGGPFVVASHTPGLELVLRRSDRWAEGGGPFLEEVTLVEVPDATTARQLFEAGQLDVIMPPAGLQRSAGVRRIQGAKVLTGPTGGWWVGLDLSPGLPQARRAGVVATVDRDRFVSVLLPGEAQPVGELDPMRPPAASGPWATVGAQPVSGLSGATVTITGELEEPMTGLLERAMQKRAAGAGGRFELRNAQAADVEGWLTSGQFDAALSMHFDSPSFCWTCHFGSLDAGLSNSADGGDLAAATALEGKVRAQALLVPLWRPITVVAVRGGLKGVSANGYALSGAWDAADWWRAP